MYTIKWPSHLSPYVSLRVWNSTHDLRMIYVFKHDCASHLRNYFVRAGAIICAQTTSADRPSSIIQRASPHDVCMYWYLQVILRVGPVRLIRACRRNLLPEAPVWSKWEGFLRACVLLLLLLLAEARGERQPPDDAARCPPPRKLYIYIYICIYIYRERERKRWIDR